MKRMNKGNEGFTLIELMIVVAIIGVLAVLAIFGVRQYLANAKSAEATNSIGAINRQAVAAFERESAPAALLAAGALSAANVNALCGNSTLVPAAIPLNKKYQPNSAVGSDYNTGSATLGWLCLQYEMNEPQYYQYAYTLGAAARTATPAPVPAGAAWLSEAAGNLNGDAVSSSFITGGRILNGRAITFTAVSIARPTE